MAIQNIQYLKTRTLLSDKGTYLLMLESRGHLMIEVGKRGAMALEPGFYLYVGSAFGPGGIKARVGRHLSADKPLRWHIDYLRRVTTVREVCISYDPRQLESKWVDA
ncbi:MAG: GIY-YIG nuclease family protein, partial [Gammaproteobacteria bacterium]|nr:GIY-YIG nuclease family protein [Gammaproteobacteria bacterium]